MAIKGLTDKAAAFPIIGELRKGEEKPKEGNRPGKDLTYFRFTTDDALAMKMFTEAYPDQNTLRNINVFLPHKTADENIDSWIEKWVAGGLVYRSDGETMVLWRTDKGGYSTEPKPDFNQELDGNGKRKDGSGQVGRLSVIIPELGRFATVTVLTTSKHDIINLTRQLRSYEALRGDLRGIPFIIKRRPHKISTPGQNGERARREKWLLSIETQPAWTMAQLGAMERAALPASEIIEAEEDYFIKGLPSGISDPFDEPEEKAEEAPQPQPANGKADKPYKFPSNAAKNFYDTVQSSTNQYYSNPPHLLQVIGGWFKFDSEDLWQEKLSAAVDHARQKREADKVEVETQVSQDEIPF